MKIKIGGNEKNRKTLKSSVLLLIKKCQRKEGEENEGIGKSNHKNIGSLKKEKKKDGRNAKKEKYLKRPVSMLIKSVKERRGEKKELEKVIIKVLLA